MEDGTDIHEGSKVTLQSGFSHLDTVRFACVGKASK